MFYSLTRRGASAKRLHHKAFNIAKNLKYDGCQGDLASMAYRLFDKKTSCGVIKNENMSNKETSH